MNSVGPTAQAAPGSLAGFDSLERMLETYLPAEQLREARRVLYGALSTRQSLASRWLLTHPRSGLNGGEEVQAAPLSDEELRSAQVGGWDLQGALLFALASSPALSAHLGCS